MTNAILIFTLAVIFRALSGLQNGFGYDRKHKAVVFTTIALTAVMMFVAFYFNLDTLVKTNNFMWAPASLLIISSGFNGWQMANFISHPVKLNLVHDVETVLTGSFILALFLIDWKADWIPLLFAHYPGMLLHKIGVNIPPPNTPWNHNGTDDKTGKTVKIFGIPVPRLSFNARLVLSGLSIIGFVIWLIW